jgi:hypothetical protein
MTPTHDEYLGDGVYASFDGHQIWLAANHHDNKVIALEAPVFFALLRYAEKHNLISRAQPAAATTAAPQSPD